MNAGLRRLADYLGSSYWFVPTIMAIGAVLLAVGMVSLDAALGSAWMGDYSWGHRRMFSRAYASRP